VDVPANECSGSDPRVEITARQVALALI